MNILILTVSIGSGHKRAAQSLAAAFGRLQPAADVRIIDLLDFLPAGIVGSCLNLYLKSLAVFPQGYGYLYAWGNRSRAARQGNGFFSRFFLRKLQQATHNFAPQAVICTHATAAAVVNLWSQRHLTNFYRAGVVTDFVVHRLWLYELIDDYFVADEAQKRFICQQNKLPAERVQAFGIPVDERFLGGVQESDGKGVKHILVMGGGGGLMPMRDIFEALETVDISLKVTYLTGNNRKLGEQLRDLTAGSKHSCQVLGFIDDVYSVMKTADLLVSKAGGLSMSEALCVGLPILLYRPLPGQERANADFLIKRGAAVEFSTNDELVNRIDEIFRIDSKKLKLMRRAALELAKPAAGLQIARYILNKICI